ncbi:MAG: helix-turn-helix domain-containing protein [bacterium]|jgi:phage antirepressor YoqD-like protein|uniref:DNA-binding protein n=1 Tax=Candidatus Acididesulfobacter diazotrophicus TaxID=2597226 RepID=A0A519BJY1_9DELT|nr:MAG: DNA-binding protein [Candidatus Acididesulfobacter diazotrophicus]
MQINKVKITEKEIEKNCLLTVSQTAKYLNISKKTLYAFIYGRKLPFIKLPTALPNAGARKQYDQYRFSVFDLDNFIQNNRVISFDEGIKKIKLPY